MLTLVLSLAVTQCEKTGTSWDQQQVLIFQDEKGRVLADGIPDREAHVKLSFSSKKPPRIQVETRGASIHGVLKRDLELNFEMLAPLRLDDMVTIAQAAPFSLNTEDEWRFPPPQFVRDAVGRELTLPLLSCRQFALRRFPPEWSLTADDEFVLGAPEIGSVFDASDPHPYLPLALAKKPGGEKAMELLPHFPVRVRILERQPGFLRISLWREGLILTGWVDAQRVSPASIERPDGGHVTAMAGSPAAAPPPVTCPRPMPFFASGTALGTLAAGTRMFQETIDGGVVAAGVIDLWLHPAEGSHFEISAKDAARCRE